MDSLALERVNLPSGLQSLTFGFEFNQNLKGVDFQKCSSERDIWKCIQKDPDTLAFRASNLHWATNLTRSRSDLAKWSSELDMWKRLQPEAGRSDPAT